MTVRLFWVLIFAGFFWGCFSDGGSYPAEGIPSSDVHRQMLLVEGSKDTVTLGTNKSGAKIDESPEMKVLLDYDFWMDVHKVTCGEFKSVAEKRIDCGSDSVPVVNVTFFDAVLFANEKSKMDDLDTVYEYSSVEFDRDGHCVNLAGFSFHLDRMGYRLPTEAEWVKVASEDDKCSDCFEEEKEFVNDYKGLFKNEIVTNFAGASSANGADERIIKGGSSSNLYSRGGTYPVSPSTYDDHVGFRLALGAIPNATFLDQDGKEVSSPIRIVLSALKLWDYTKTSKVKLVFKNEVTGNLNYIDYTNEKDIVEIVDTIPAYHPDISPDGKKVAFCTGIEGIDQTSRLYVRNLDPKGSGLVKLDVKSAAIPRWSVLANGDTVITYVTKAGDNSNESTFKSASTWQVPFMNGKFGTPVKLFDGSFHGGISEDESLAVTGSKILRARVYKKEKIWYNKEQACNVSLAKDYSKRTAFLDFGGSTGKNFVGEKYRVHEYLFIADSSGNLVQSVRAPSGFVFDHSEWATGRVNQNLVATLTNADGAHTKIVLVHLADSSVTNLVEGEELWYPNLWIQGKKQTLSSSSKVSSSSKEIASNSSSSRNDGKGSSSSGAESSSSKNSSSSGESSSSSDDSSSSGESSSSSDFFSSSSEELVEFFELDEDSAGFYAKNNEFQEAHWSYKMELVWTYWDTADVVVFGSSRSHHGVIPKLFSDQFYVVNLASAHGNLHSTHYIAVNYVLPHFKKLKYIIVGISLDRLWLGKVNSFFYLYSPEIKGYVYDANHDFWKSGVPEGLKEMTHDVPKVSSYAANLTERGYMPLNSCSDWRSSAHAEKDIGWLDTGLVRLEETLGYLTDIIELAAERNIKVIGVEFPQNPNYKESNAYGKYGLRNSDAPQILERLDALTQKYSNFTFFDQHKMGEHDYLEGMSYDDDHLCRAGAMQMTHRLDSLLKTLE
ncbi:TIGR02171 family protein [Fibrobacter sp. UWB13]|uniref:TIGR02171 family lipoprotein n=1 Tax=Fibrobacter sp. UWB13 TaxID=1896204 RepID=UPI000A0CC04B|nr:TIGR02171 family protein [Fibrobacter sp. UWB13]SMG20334.1 TIGR02171 family protein [Fibrobacter sp. UWB13]